MFISKLQNGLCCKIPITRKIHNNIITYQSKKILSKKLQNVKKIPQKCKEYQDKIAKCPKPTHEQRCCKPLFPKPEPKCKTEIIEQYGKVYEDITNNIKLILKSVQNESTLILTQFKNGIETMKNKEEAQLQEFSRSIKERLETLTMLDPSCVSLKRKSALSLNHQIRQGFNNVQCDIVPKVEKIKEALEILERDMLISIDRAKSLIFLCRKCDNPQALTKCIDENTATAKQMLDETLKSMQVRLDKITALQHETLKYHETNIAEVIEIHRKKHKAFLDHLDKCIRAIKNANKQ